MLNADRVTAPIRRILSTIQFGSTDAIAIALSGGGDSTALSCLVRDHFAERGEADRLFAVTVDHGLRAESAGEAERAGRFCAALGIEHRIRRWHGDKPDAGLQAAAREARYRLIADAAGERGCAIVLTGHTLDDQAETVAMRRQRGTGRGLSGIAPATLYGRRTWFVRPLIGLRRDDLRGYLTARGQDWVDDPSNLDPRFERVRMRAATGEAKVDAAAFRIAFDQRRAAAAKAAEILSDEAAWRFDAGARTAEFTDLNCATAAEFPLALAVVLGWVGHGAHLPAGTVLEKAAAFCRQAQAGRKITAAGCLLECGGGRVRIGREMRNTRHGGFGFDHLLPSPDFPLAEALAARTGEGRFPAPPLSGYPD